MIVLKTERLFLETWELQDFDSFAAIARDPVVMRFIAQGQPWSDARIGWFMGIQSTLQETLGFCNWKLTHQANNELIGVCGLAPFQPINEIEIGWWLKPEYWKKGIAFEAAECVLRCAFEKHGLNCVVARVYRANTRSIELMDRLGMVFDQDLETNSVGEILLFRLEK